MRMIRLFLATLLLFPCISIAQDREFNQSIYVLSATGGVPHEDLAAGCAWAVPYVPTEVVGGANYRLDSVASNRKRGVLRDDGKALGALWVCVGTAEPREDSALGTVPERAVAFALFIGDTVYGALGSWSPRTEPDIPQQGMAVWGGGAVVVALVNNQPAGTVGAMTFNLLDNLEDIEGYREDIIITLRLFTERNSELEAAVGGLSGSFN